MQQVYKKSFSESHGTKQIPDFFNTKPKKQAMIMKYCISKVMSEREDKEDEVIFLSCPKRVVKTSEKTCMLTRKRERNKGDYGSTVQFSQFI